MTREWWTFVGFALAPGIGIALMWCVLVGILTLTERAQERRRRRLREPVAQSRAASPRVVGEDDTTARRRIPRRAS